MLPWQRVLRCKVVLEYILVEFANMEEIFQSLCRSKRQHLMLVISRLNIASAFMMPFMQLVG